MDEGVCFSDLVEAVQARAAGRDEVARLDAAIAVSREVAALAEELLDHFVRQARAADLSWTLIGQRLGVSKQAARMRFAERVDALVVDGADLELAPRLVTCLERAGEEARADGSAEVGTHHLLIGLMEEGFAAAVLERLGVRVEAMRTASASLFGVPAPAGERVPPHSEQARCALNGACGIACSRGADGGFVRTEHLLFVLATDPGGRARRVLNELGVDVAAIKRELAPLRPQRFMNIRAGKRRRQHAQERMCSFCRRPRSATGPLVAGPGVHICESCISHARDALAGTACTHD